MSQRLIQSESVITNIVLNNPTDESYVLRPQLTNYEVFALQLSASAKQLARIASHKSVDLSRQGLKTHEKSVLSMATDTSKSTSARRIEDVSSNHLVLRPKSTIRLGLKFTPCYLGEKEHEGKIRFTCEKLSEWIFILHGRGLPPQPREPISTYVAIGSASILILPLTNPLHHPVVMDIYLTPISYSGLFKRMENARKIAIDETNGSFGSCLSGHLDLDSHQASFIKSPKTSIDNRSSGQAFQLLLKHNRNIHLASKMSFDIPISFAPMEMREYEAICCVVMRRHDDEIISSNEDDPTEIRWLMPIKGIPEATSTITFPPQLAVSTGKEMAHYSSISPGRLFPLITGVARSVMKYQIELNLSSSLPPTMRTSTISASMLPEDRPSEIRIRPASSSSSWSVLSERSAAKASPTNLIGTSAAWSQLEHGVVTWKLEPVVPEEEREIAEFIDLDNLLSSSINIHIVDIKRSEKHGSIELVLGVIFTPPRPFKCSAELTVRSEFGAIWRFALNIEAKDPPVDDVIFMPIQRLGHPVKARLVLTSQSTEPEPFVAFLYPNNQTSFSICPKLGVLPGKLESDDDKRKDSTSLPPVLTVTFKPTSYGKPKRARLIVQTSTMEWHYQLIGDLPPYVPPEKSADSTTATARDGTLRASMLKRKKVNVILKNQQTLGMKESMLLPTSQLLRRP
ncbi:unnamed protein product [Calicophoron daubneyi]|uniref:CFAP47-like immunoglobulin-like domain-containing protein n=1 Tax=Calicophoron daubneyi TaxID=300641 RepID=A0AAV2TMB8_CALDB